MLPATSSQPLAIDGGAAEAPQAHAAAALRAFRQALLRWHNPEWLPCMAFLLLPALLCQAFGDGQRAAFFFGTAVYLGVLKWLGWLVFTRFSLTRPAFLLFPAEVFAGLAVACLWFYLRNLAGWLWPASYSLRELSALPYLAAAVHLLAAAVVGKYLWPGWHGLLRRTALYLPFAAILTVALWQVSAALHVQSTDPIFHAYSARVYATEGVFFRHPDNGRELIYTAGFGAMNAVAVSLAPLTVVQAVNLQHVLLLVVAVFLATATVAMLSGRTLWPIHLLGAAFLILCPLHSLYPDLYHASTPRQAVPALVLAVALLPLLTRVGRAWHYYLAVGVQAMLALLALTLNPAAAPFVVLAGLAALVVNTHTGRKTLGLGAFRLLSGQAGLALLLAGLALACDRYYATYLGRLVRPPAAAAAAEPAPATIPAESKPAPFSAARGFQQVRAAGLLGLSPVLSGAVLQPPPFDAATRDWPRRLPQSALPALAFLLALFALLPFVTARGRAQAPPAARPLAALVAGCLVMWLALKLGVGFLVGGLSKATWEMDLLQKYMGFLLLRGELLVLFVCLLAAGATLYLLLERRWDPSLVGAALVVPALCLALIGSYTGHQSFQRLGLSVPPTANGCGVVSAPTAAYWEVTADVALAQWVSAHVPPENGRIGLAAMVFLAGPTNQEGHIYPMGGAQALALYGRHHNVCFVLPMLDGYEGFIEGYRAHVKDKLDVQWCLNQNIRYFFISRNSLRRNEGLEQAIARGQLRPFHCVGEACLYEVVPD